MLAGCSDNQKSYMLIDVETNQVTYDRDVVVDEETRSFHSFSLEFKIIMEPPIMAKDSGVKIQISPPQREEDFDNFEESPRFIPVIFDPHSPN